MKNQLLIYGCNGYTGSLISRMAQAQGLRPILAGRNKQAVELLAAELELQSSVFDLVDNRSTDAALRNCSVVLHCAGPFSQTSQPMVEACIRNKVHYLDITGEIAVFEAAKMKDRAAKDAGIMLLPGVGFDVVPSDCLSGYLHELLPTATHLSLCLMSKGGRLSHGTAITITEGLGMGSACRQNGKIVSTKAGCTTREIDFGFTKKVGVEIPWGDVSTAYTSTGIPNITVYNVVPKSLITTMKISNYLAPILKTKWVRERAIASIKKQPAGPSSAERESAQSYIWGEVKDAVGNYKRAMLTLPEGYQLTTMTAVAIATATINGTIKTGYQTPAMVFGVSYIRGFAGVTLTDL